MLGFLESPKKVENNLRKLQQDNHEKITVNISNEDLEFEVKSITRWRKNVLNRFFSLGSSDYDKIIKELSLRGY